MHYLECYDEIMSLLLDCLLCPVDKITPGGINNTKYYLPSYLESPAISIILKILLPPSVDFAHLITFGYLEFLLITCIFQIEGYMLWFNFILGSFFIFLCFILVIIYILPYTKTKENEN